MKSVPKDLSLDSEWLNGPAYLKKPIEEWPTDRNFADRKLAVELPMKEIKKPYRELLTGLSAGYVGEVSSGTVGGPGSRDNDILVHFDFGRRTNNWGKLVRSTSYLFMWRAKILCGDGQSVDLLAKEMSIIFWMRVAMPATNKAASEGKLKHLSPLQHSRYPDMLVLIGRAVKGFRSLFQKEYLPIIMSTTRTFYLVMMWAHYLDHGGVDVTYQTSLQVAWVVRGRALARGIKKSCVRRRYLAKQLIDQQMSVLPEHLIMPCPCFSYVAVDLCGPFVCKKEGGSQTTRWNTGKLKVWAVLFVCLQVKAVKIYIVGGLHTEDFLLAWDRFVADHGQPLVAYSDRGTNLVSAAREGGDTVPSYDWDKIAGCSKGKTEWKFHPSGSQFRNGAVEIFVKKFKRSLKHNFGSRLMFLLELQTSFKVVSSILNSRPISARWGPRGGNDPDYLSPLTPNMLLTGRANTGVPVRDYDLSDKPIARLQYVEDCTAQWWNQFMTQNFSSLVPRQKWYFERRNMKIGDVVLLQYEGKCRPATYRLAVVVEVELDSDKLVRTVTVQYSLLSELPASERHLYKGITKKKVRVSVQRLVLILPVEERDITKDLGEKASGELAPHNEVSRLGATVKHSSGSYDVVWDSVRRRYVQRVEGKSDLQVGRHNCRQVDNKSSHKLEQSGGEAQVQENRRDTNKITENSNRREFKLHLKSSSSLKEQMKYEDYERNII